MSITPAPGPLDAAPFNPVNFAAAPEPRDSVPPFIWAAALQVYWLVHGFWGMLSGGFLLGIGLLGASGAMRQGFPGSEGERILLAMALNFLAGAVDVAFSTVLTYGLLTLKAWSYRVFMVWLPVKVGLWIAVLVMPVSIRTAGTAGQTQSSAVLLITVSGVILQVAALIGGLLLVRRGNVPVR